MLKQKNIVMKIITVIIVTQLVVGLSPTIPYSKFIGTGRIQRSGNQSKQNFQIIMVGKYAAMNPDSVFELTGLKLYSTGNTSVSITDSTGSFSLNLKTTWRVDSLAYRVIAVDKPKFTSSFFSLPVPSETIYGRSSNTSSGCKSCMTETDSHEFIEGVHYNLPEKTIVIPY